MATDITPLAVSFAAICQTAYLLQELGRFGIFHEELAYPLVYALEVTDPETAMDVYPEKDVMAGYRIMLEAFASRNAREQNKIMELHRYILGAIRLGKTLMSRPNILNNVYDQLDLLLDVDYVERFITTDDPNNTTGHTLIEDSYMSDLAKIYRSEISDCKVFSFLVFGEESYLSQQQIQDRIRALLLCILRAAILWLQVGGSSGQFKLFFFQMKPMLIHAQQMLRHSSN